MRRAIATGSRRRRPRRPPRRRGKCGLAEAVARNLFKLMAYKDEYEVARLYSNGEFLRQVAAEFDGEQLRFEFHLAPPLLARRDPATGVPRKITVRAVDDAGVPAAGAAEIPARHRLRSVRLRRRAPHRAQAHRRLRGTLAEAAGARSTPDNHHLAVGIAAIPEKIRGFGHVKLRHLQAAKADEAALLEQFRAGAARFLKRRRIVPARSLQHDAAFDAGVNRALALQIIDHLIGQERSRRHPAGPVARRGTWRSRRRRAP